MKIIILVFLLGILQACTRSEAGIFEKISNKTWFEDKGFAGTSIVFFKTGNGLQKAIRQINGSGIPVLRSEIYDMDFQQDTIFLYNGLNLTTSEKLVDIIYSFDKNTGQIRTNGKPLRIIHQEPILYVWTTERKYDQSRIDLELLSGISIGRNQIYDHSEIEKVLTERKNN